MGFLKGSFTIFILFILAFTLQHYVIVPLVMPLYQKHVLPEVKYPMPQIVQHCNDIIGSAHFDQVDDRVYIGDICAATSEDILRKLNITHIINACERCPNAFLGISYLNIPLNEYGNEDSNDLLQFFVKSNRFIDITFVMDKSRILISSWTGEARSSALWIAYLMKTQSLSYLNAREQTAKHRNVYLTPNLENALTQYEHILKQVKTQNKHVD